MESEAIDKRMVREATIGLVVLVALIGLLFFTIWLKAKSIWADASEALITAPVNVYTLGNGDVLVPTKKPSPVPLPQIESNEIVDLGEMRPITNERMAAMFGSSKIDEQIRVAAVEPNIGLPEFPPESPALNSPSLPSPTLPSPSLATPNLPTSSLPTSNLPPTSLPSVSSLPLSPQVSEPVPTRSEVNLPTGPNLPPLPDAAEERAPTGLPQINATSPSDVVLTSSEARDVMAHDEVQPVEMPQQPSLRLPVPSDTTPIPFLPPAGSRPRLPTPDPLPSVNEGSDVVTNPAAPVTQVQPASVAPENGDPLNGALRRAATTALPDLPTIAQSSRPDAPRFSSENQAAEPPPSDIGSQVTQVQVQDPIRESDDATSSSASYTAAELKMAMRRVSLPTGMTMDQLSSRLYGDARYATALQQLNHRRADDRGRFLPGTQIAYLPSEMLAFVYPDLIPTKPSGAESGMIQPVEYQERSTEPVDGTAESVSRKRTHANLDRQPGTDSIGVEVNKTPEWIVTQGGESLFQLAVDHFDQASYYLYLYEWNRETIEGRYRPTDPLPQGLRIRLAPREQ